MKAQKDSFEPGTAKLDDFFYWIEERTRIYLKREADEPKPWTTDAILRDWKFTNAYRQLDRGTVALRNFIVEPAISNEAPIDWVVWNIMWYRLFNLDEHAVDPLGGFIPGDERKALYEYLRLRKNNGAKVFTSAHMTTGVAGEDKIDTYIRACEDAWMRRELVVEACKVGTLESVFNALLPGYMIGRFIAYEIACDLRFVAGLWPGGSPTDVLTWANMGPGAARGLARLGLLPTLRFTAQQEGVWHMSNLHTLAVDVGRVPDAVRQAIPWPFELREIEHSLCEFDKYQRVLRNEGQARMKFNGRA